MVSIKDRKILRQMFSHKSILLSLEKRKLLTHSQRERCLVELEKQYSREQKSRRRA